MSDGNWTCPDCGEQVEATAHTCGGHRAVVVGPRDKELAQLRGQLALVKGAMKADEDRQRARIEKLEALLREALAAWDEGVEGDVALWDQIRAVLEEK